MKYMKLFVSLCAAFFMTSYAHASGDIELVRAVNGEAGVTYSTNIQIMAMMTLLSLLPAIVLTMTAFPRILIVLALLRQAVGTNSNPSNKIMIGVAMLLTIFVMYPVFDEIKTNAMVPYYEQQISDTEFIAQVEKPVRKFMLNQTRKQDIELFLSMTGTTISDKSEVPFFTLVMAFLTSELQTAFQIGFMIFIPFLVVDLIVASTLMGLGMMMVSPMIISIPVKLMLFVLIDGWALVLGTLARSFYF